MKNLQNNSDIDYDTDKKGESFLSDSEFFGTLHEGIDYNKFECISEIPEFKRFAAEHQWSARKEFGYPYRADVFKFLGKVYADWFAAASEHNLPFTQADLFAVDSSAWGRVQQDIKLKKKENPDMERGHMPFDLYLPNQKTAALNAIADPEEVRDLLQEREVLARIKARQRARRTPQP